MTLEELIAQFRTDSDDKELPYLSSDADVTQWLNEATEEACIRAKLIRDVSTAAVCSIAVTAPTRVYTLHTAVIDITRAAFTPTGSSTEYVLDITDQIEQDRNFSDWRTRVDVPRQIIQDDTTIQLGCIPSTNGVLAIECYRLPLLNIEDRTDESPEIGRIHHRHLVYWALHRCFQRPDAEVYDQGRSDRGLMEFTKVFGLRPDANYRRDFQANRPLFNKAVW